MNLYFFVSASMFYRFCRTMCVIPALSLLLLASTPSVAEENSSDIRNYQNKLDRVYKSIDKVKNHLKSTRYKRNSVVTTLHKLEEKISSNSRNLMETERKIKKLGREIRDIRQEQSKLDRKLNQHRQALADQLRSHYALGEQKQIKMLLNQQDASTLGRMNVYFDYLNRSRKQHIIEFRRAISVQQELKAKLDSTLDRQRSALDDQKKRKKTLTKQRLERKRLLITLDADIEDQETTLSELEDSRLRIENLLQSLGELLADIPPGPDGEKSFAERRGRLPWPVSGRFLARFGQSKHHGDLRWNGVVIDSAYGTPVRAVSGGRVAFSDWLQGFGFITIIDHGDGYMSLYGHNESLFKQPGDWVRSGETIATVGDSGGQTQSGLYFEVRVRGKPVDPGKWCSAKVAHTE